MVNLFYDFFFFLSDVDECAQADLCLGGVCANTEGSYTCTRCKAGYRVSQDRQRCEGKSTLIQDKSLLLFPPSNDSLNTSGQFVNSPLNLLHYATEFPPRIQSCGGACADVHMFLSDIDECQSLSTCANGICLNSEGSYTCENCPTGYKVSYDGELCEGEFIT